MRKGAFNEVALSNGCNKVAYGQNKDDAIETLFMSLFYEGRIFCFAPVTYFDRTDITAIRPLIYTPEDEIENFIKQYNIGLSFNNCSVDGKTKRQQIKEFKSDCGARNEVEGKIGTAKTRYGMGLIHARLPQSGLSVITLAVMAMNLSKLAKAFLRRFFGLRYFTKIFHFQTT